MKKMALLTFCLGLSAPAFAGVCHNTNPDDRLEKIEFNFQNLNAGVRYTSPDGVIYSFTKNIVTGEEGYILRAELADGAPNLGMESGDQVGKGPYRMSRPGVRMSFGQDKLIKFYIYQVMTVPSSYGNYTEKPINFNPYFECAN